MIHKFDSGVKFVFAGGSERLFVDPIKAELVALEAWTASLEVLAASNEEIVIDELPKSQYLPKLGKRSMRAAGAITGYSEDVYGKGELEAQWRALINRVAKISHVKGWDR